MSEDVKTCFGSEGALRIMHNALPGQGIGVRCFGEYWIGLHLICGRSPTHGITYSGPVRWFVYSESGHKWVGVSRRVARFLLRGMFGQEEVKSVRLRHTRYSNGIARALEGHRLLRDTGEPARSDREEIGLLVRDNAELLSKLRKLARDVGANPTEGNHNLIEFVLAKLREMGVAP